MVACIVIPFPSFIGGDTPFHSHHGKDGLHILRSVIHLVAYLAVRKQVMFSGGIGDWESYFFGCYRRMLQTGTRDSCRYDFPGDEYFVRLGETDCTEETEEREEMLTGCDRLVRDIRNFLRRHFSDEDDRIFMLRFHETGSSFRTIAGHMGCA